MSDNYWSRKADRRTALRQMAVASGGIAALSLVGCGGGSGNDRNADEPATQQLDPTKGNPGGLARIQISGYPAGLTIANSASDPNRFAGLTHQGLLEFRFGTPAVPAHDISTGPDLAKALPEQPNELTYIYKLNDAKFHNGHAVTAEDVKYSYDRYAFWDNSAYKMPFQWMDKVEVTDSKTVVIRSKQPFAEGLASMTGYTTGFIMAKEHEESPEAEKRLMGSSPFLFVDTTPPLTTRFKKNPDFWQKPYPYFETVEVLGTVDENKQVADLLSRQTHAT